MRFRFIGKYTNGHTNVSIRDVVFNGHEPVTVDDDDVALKLMSHPEVEEVTDKPQLGHDNDGHAGGSMPKRRGRPRKDD